MNSIVVHYKELALKGRNRPWFIHVLVRNLRTAVKDLGVRSVRSVMGRIEIDLGDRTPFDDVRDRLRRVFGHPTLLVTRLALSDPASPLGVDIQCLPFQP